MIVMTPIRRQALISISAEKLDIVVPESAPSPSAVNHKYGFFGFHRVVFLHRVIGEMGKTVIELAGVIFLQTKTHIELSIKPYSRRVVVFHYHPLPDVKFMVVDSQGILKVLLSDVLSLLPERKVKDVTKL